VLRRCPEIPPEHMQGGSRCPGPAVEPERARWHDPVLGRWLQMGTPERPALCLRGYPRWPRVALSRVSDPLVTLPGWVGFREPRGRLGGRYAKKSQSARPMCAPHPVPRGQRAYARPARRGASPGAGGAGPRRRRRTELRREGTGATARKLTENMGILYKNLKMSGSGFSGRSASVHLFSTCTCTFTFICNLLVTG
jgi:hypothetical protein